ncbi:sigma-54-dependent Fis family transcriptional regulator [Lujinxingia litoralis]|uniref:Sigma-54-dependent Fis family transcriptional regulator n=1 Tax=Lujinxingia litoralis TaxID=2211119 RepID=A0A328CCQ3_9DELT|nr:sigma 54-interacting transcriptional regulator [Lujinxingia litoralis]RAL23967.1 sigma-54-dependent Fis family transcriptional regulator [Lujinxingia litoralis]
MIRRPQRRGQNFHGMISGAPQMEALFRLLERVARANVSVLVRGETGTGKELVARAIHELSPRQKNAFRAVNCASFSSELLASELFGHVRGAFTGAVRDRRGLFALADGGSVFLDEIAEIPLEVQARLLRVLQEQRFVPVGGTDAVKVDVRLISATNKALRREVEEGRFREDLMYRVRVVPIFLPPLVERQGDVELLVWHFIEKFNERAGMPRRIEAISAEAYQALLGYAWPGNIRELRNVIEYAFVVGEGEALAYEDLPPELRGEGPRAGRGEREEEGNGERSERQRIVAALRAAGGSREDAAEALGISRTTLWRRMKEFGVEG